MNNLGLIINPIRLMMIILVPSKNKITKTEILWNNPILAESSLRIKVIYQLNSSMIYAILFISPLGGYRGGRL